MVGVRLHSQGPVGAPEGDRSAGGGVCGNRVGPRLCSSQWLSCDYVDLVWPDLKNVGNQSLVSNLLVCKC